MSAEFTLKILTAAFRELGDFTEAHKAYVSSTASESEKEQARKLLQVARFPTIYSQIAGVLTADERQHYIAGLAELAKRLES